MLLAAGLAKLADRARLQQALRDFGGLGVLLSLTELAMVLALVRAGYERTQLASGKEKEKGV